MRFKTTIAAVLAIATGSLSFAGLAEAGHRHNHRVVIHRNNNGAGVAAGIIGGLAAGAIVGGALSRPRVVVQPAPVYVPAYGPQPWTADWYAYCSSKYRSFDARSGTYLGYDGLRHFCQ